jgi:hypothetical protein
MVCKAQLPHFLFFLFWFADYDRIRRAKHKRQTSAQKKPQKQKKGRRTSQVCGWGRQAFIRVSSVFFIQPIVQFHPSTQQFTQLTLIRLSTLWLAIRSPVITQKLQP